MPAVNMTDITRPTEGRIWTEEVEGATRIYVSAVGSVINDAGKRIRDERTVELTTAAQKQAANTILNAWLADAKADWSIT